MRTLLVTRLVASLVLVALVAAASANPVPVRVEGRVQWISGALLVLAPDGAPSVNVDLSQVSQDQYTTLAVGDRVIIDGALTDARDRVVATSIRLVNTAAPTSGGPTP